MGLFDFIRRPVQGAVDDTRGFLDGLMSPGIQATPQPMEDAPVGDVGQMRRPDVLTQKPSLLEGLGKYITSSDGLMALGAGLKGLSGDDNAGFEVAQMQRQRRADAEREAEKAQAKAEAAAEKQRKQVLNQAFWASFGDDGKFDRARYAQLVKENAGAYVDPEDFTAALTAGRAAGPKYGISGGASYTQDQDTGETTWGDVNPVEAEKQRLQALRDQYARQHQLVMEKIASGQLSVAQGRLALSRLQHEARVAAGGYGTPGVGSVAVPDDDVEIDQ